MMPVEKLPAASWQSTLALGFISSVFDNIPLTALALKQGGYDWGVLAYAVGFGGSMIWFGSSAGVALSNMYPQGDRSRSGSGTAGLSQWPMSLGSLCCSPFSDGILMQSTRSVLSWIRTIDSGCGLLIRKDQPRADRTYQGRRAGELQARHHREDGTIGRR